MTLGYAKLPNPFTPFIVLGCPAWASPAVVDLANAVSGAGDNAVFFHALVLVDHFRGMPSVFRLR